MDISKAIGNKFQIIFPVLPFKTSISDNDQFRLNIIDGLLPSINLTAEDVPWRGGNVVYERGFENFGDWTTKFAIDSNFYSWLTLAEWMFSIANNADNFGLDDQSHTTDCNLHMLDNFNNKIIDIQFINVWPQALSDVSLSYQDNNEVLTCDVTFKFDRFNIL